MNIEKERKAFEKWYVEKYRGASLKRFPKHWKEGGEYIADRAEQTWHAWQAVLQSDRVQAWKRDAERLDWLADPKNSIGNVQLPIDCVKNNLHSLRAAIDEAMVEASKIYHK